MPGHCHSPSPAEICILCSNPMALSFQIIIFWNIRCFSGAALCKHLEIVGCRNLFQSCRGEKVQFDSLEKVSGGTGTKVQQNLRRNLTFHFSYLLCFILLHTQTEPSRAVEKKGTRSSSSILARSPNRKPQSSFSQVPVKVG